MVVSSSLGGPGSRGGVVERAEGAGSTMLTEGRRAGVESSLAWDEGPPRESMM